MSSHATIASCSLNQWALDWEGNSIRIKASILEAKTQGATLRVGSELEVCNAYLTVQLTVSRTTSVKNRALIKLDLWIWLPRPLPRGRCLHKLLTYALRYSRGRSLSCQ